ncbi:MAG: 16S rRNA (uracil(1498)-N(3))-methyltransferase, partial [Paludibacteraceae bacterium]|nr:16S rRNA (uracil(1498)-N(3))-methyltransferase [Paludibacteraceae bacterium]
MFLFYTPDIATVSELPEAESQHACRVLRMKAGDHVWHTDGRGTLYESEILNPHPRHCQLRILHQELQPERPFSIRIAIAPTKNIDRLEWMVEKCVEIGVDRITPLLCNRSERRALKTERLQKIVVSAAMQSLKTRIPLLDPLTPLDRLIIDAKEQQRFIAHCREDERTPLFAAIRRGGSVVILIGPEGDFDEQEVSAALQAGFQPVTLGQSRLRTETAGFVACHTA